MTALPDDDGRCWTRGCASPADAAGSRRLGLRADYCHGCLSTTEDHRIETRRWLASLGFGLEEREDGQGRLL